MDIQAKVKEILEILLEHKILSEDVTAETEELWDSLKHLEIVVTLEEEFGIKFKEEDISKLKSTKVIIQKIQELL